MNRWTKHALLCLGGVLASAIAIGAYAYAVMWERYGSAQDALDARIERFGGLVQAKANVDARLESARSAQAALLNVGPDSIANDLLQQLRQMITEADCSLVSSQAALEPSPGSPFDRARLSVTVTGEWAKLVGLVASIQMRQPALWIQSGTIMKEVTGSGPVAQLSRMVLQLEAPAKVQKDEKQP